MCCYSSAGWFRAFLRCTQTSVLFRYFSKRCLSRTRATWCRTPISSSDGCVQSRHRHGDSRFSRDGRTPVSRNRKGLSDFLPSKNLSLSLSNRVHAFCSTQLSPCLCISSVRNPDQRLEEVQTAQSQGSCEGLPPFKGRTSVSSSAGHRLRNWEGLNRKPNLDSCALPFSSLPSP